MINYFLNYEKKIKLNSKINFDNKNRLFLNNSTFEKNNPNNFFTKYVNSNNSVKKEISLSKKIKVQENIPINNNKIFHNINSAINFKEKEFIL